MADKRFLKRRKSLFYLKLEDYVTGEEIGRLVDITDQGFKLFTKNPVPVGREMVLTLELPETFEGQEKLLFSAVALYNKNDVNPDYYSAGFEFKELPREAANAIVWLSKRFLFNE